MTITEEANLSTQFESSSAQGDLDDLAVHAGGGP
jgi:hypothetical protein